MNPKCCSIVIVLSFSILEGVCGQDIIINSTCTLQISGSPGRCKLLTKCKKIRDEVVRFSRLPQTCGFQETQPIVCCPDEPKTPAEIKCRQYSALKNRCDHKILAPAEDGRNAAKKEFPHAAHLAFENSPGEILWSCGGTIISEEYILTAAHCLVGSLSGVNVVRVGFTSDNDTAHQQKFEVLETIPHPDYDPHGAGYYDVGLVKLKRSIKIDSYANPACLFTGPQIPDKKVIATGWGTIFDMSLRKATLELIDYEQCYGNYKVRISDKVLKRGIVDEEHICVRAHPDKQRETPCMGSDGGPLQIYDANLCMYRVIGVASFGSLTCNDVVYARVSHYVKWIEDVVWPKPSDSRF